MTHPAKQPTYENEADDKELEDIFEDTNQPDPFPPTPNTTHLSSHTTPA